MPALCEKKLLVDAKPITINLRLIRICLAAGAVGASLNDAYMATKSMFTRNTNPAEAAPSAEAAAATTPSAAASEVPAAAAADLPQHDVPQPEQSAARVAVDSEWEEVHSSEAGPSGGARQPADTAATEDAEGHASTSHAPSEPAAGGLNAVTSATEQQLHIGGDGDAASPCALSCVRTLTLRSCRETHAQRFMHGLASCSPWGFYHSVACVMPVGPAAILAGCLSLSYARYLGIGYGV